MVWRIVAHLSLSACFCAPSYALQVSPVETTSGIVLRVRGDFKDGDYSRIKALLKKAHRVVGLELSSDGGHLEEGLRIAGLIRHKKLAVYVDGECNSVCAAIFFAGAARFFSEGAKIGVHSVSNDRDIEDVGSRLLTLKLARAWASDGIPPSVIGKMIATRPQGIAYLDDRDLSELHALMGNPFEKKTVEVLPSQNSR